MLSGELLNKYNDDLETISDFVLEMGKKHIPCNQNIEPTPVKNLLINFVRQKTTKQAKKAFIGANITPDKYSTLDEINDKVISLFVPAANTVKPISFKKFDETYLKFFEDSNEIHRDGTNFTEKETAEKFAKKASQFSIGNCNECRDICEVIWNECTLEARKKIGLPTFETTELPMMEQCVYRNNDVSGEELDLPENTHCFNIAGRPINSDFFDIKSWIESGKDVFIVDLWKRPGSPISVKEQLSLPQEERSLAFEWLRKQLELDASNQKNTKMKIISRRTLGEGHSQRWLKKGKSEYHFLQKNFPQTLFSEKKTPSNDRKAVFSKPPKKNRFKPY